MRHFRTIGTAWRERISDRPPADIAPVQGSADDLPAQQKFGLVFLRKASKSSLADKVLAHMQEQSISFPSAMDWRALRSSGYVALQGMRHTLTPIGLAISNDIMRDLARKYGIHEFSVQGGRGSGTMTRCTCGWSSAYKKRGDVFAIRGAQAVHLASVANGMRPATSLPDALADIESLFINSGLAKQYRVSGIAADLKNPGAGVASVSATAPGNSLEARDG